MKGNGIALPGPRQPVVQQMVMASPLNDVQIVCLMAVQLPGTAAERVGLARDIFCEAVMQERKQSLGERIKTAASLAS